MRADQLSANSFARRGGEVDTKPRRFLQLSEFTVSLLAIEVPGRHPLYLATSLRFAPFGRAPPHLCGRFALELPNDGGVHALRALLERLGAASIEVAGLSVQSADLDDVFLSLTGRDNGHHADEKVLTP